MGVGGVKPRRQKNTLEDFPKNFGDFSKNVRDFSEKIGDFHHDSRSRRIDLYMMQQRL